MEKKSVWECFQLGLKIGVVGVILIVVLAFAGAFKGKSHTATSSAPKIEKAVAVKEIKPLGELLISVDNPKLHDNISAVEKYYADYINKTVVTFTADSFESPASALIYRVNDAGIIDEIVCQPQNAGLSLTIGEIEPIIKNFVRVEKLQLENATILEGYSTPMPTIYFYEIDTPQGVAVVTIQETNGNITAFSVSEKNGNRKSYLPFLRSANGYRVSQKKGVVNPMPETRPLTAYVGNANTGKFHYSNCPEVDKMNEANKVEMATREDAINNGYVPCKKCNP